MKQEEIEKSIIKSYRKTIFRPFTRAITKYDLIKENDHICVCISGGKDSFIMAKCMQELEKHGKYPIKCEYVVMNPGFNSKQLNLIKKNAKLLGIPITIFETNIFSAVKSSNHKSSCYICAKMRRGSLYSYAQSIGCNKIALGHHFDDAIETTLLSVFYNGIFNTMKPIVKSENYENLELIRPLYLVREDSIINFVNRWGLKFNVCDCPYKNNDSKRLYVKNLIKQLKKDNEFVDLNIFKSAENVEINHIRGLYKNGEHFDVNNFFDNEK